jgi:hypothetical protein
MKRLLTAITAISLSLGGSASAQQDLGTRLGVMSLNNSGQIGDVTLYKRGPKTLVRIVMHGAGARVEPIAIHRGSDCDTLQMPAAYKLSDLKGERSSTLVDAPAAKLLSGNYNVVVFSSSPGSTHMVACSHLYQ